MLPLITLGCLCRLPQRAPLALLSRPLLAALAHPRSFSRRSRALLPERLPGSRGGGRAAAPAEASSAVARRQAAEARKAEAEAAKAKIDVDAAKARAVTEAA